MDLESIEVEEIKIEILLKKNFFWIAFIYIIKLKIELKNDRWIF